MAPALTTPNPSLQSNHLGLGLGIQTITPPNQNTSIQFTDSDSSSDIQEYDDDDASPIHIIIHTPLLVKGDNNLVAIDPSAQANKISTAIVKSLKQLSHGGDGMAMIDENGRPRPIKVEVMAGVTVAGSKNVVGEQAVLGSVVGAGIRKGAEDVKGGPVPVKELKEIRKRERSDGDAVEAGAKRVKKA